MNPVGRSRWARGLAFLAIAIFAAISVAASLGQGSALFGFVQRIPGTDFTAHFLLSGMLSFAVTYGFAPRTHRVRLRGAAGCMLLVLLAVTIEEIAQLLIPARSFSMLDLLAGLSGVVIFGSGALAAIRLRGEGRGSAARIPDPAKWGKFEADHCPE